VKREQRFPPEQLHEVEGQQKYRVELSNRIASLEDLNAAVEINSA
jgi:hypothetical protein